MSGHPEKGWQDWSGVAKPRDDQSHQRVGEQGDFPPEPLKTVSALHRIDFSAVSLTPELWGIKFSCFDLLSLG